MPENAEFAQRRGEEECLQNAKVYLADVGFGEMEPCFVQQYDGMAVANFAAVQDGAHVTEASLPLVGKSNLAYPISINGITPYRKKDGSFSLTLALGDGANLIIVQNGAAKLELIVTKD